MCSELLLACLSIRVYKSDIATGSGPSSVASAALPYRTRRLFTVHRQQGNPGWEVESMTAASAIKRGLGGRGLIGSVHHGWHTQKGVSQEEIILRAEGAASTPRRVLQSIIELNQRAQPTSVASDRNPSHIWTTRNPTPTLLTSDLSSRKDAHERTKDRGRLLLGQALHWTLPRQLCLTWAYIWSREYLGTPIAGTNRIATSSQKGPVPIGPNAVDNFSARGLLTDILFRLGFPWTRPVLVKPGRCDLSSLAHIDYQTPFNQSRTSCSDRGASDAAPLILCLFPMPWVLTLETAVDNLAYDGYIISRRSGSFELIKPRMSQRAGSRALLAATRVQHDRFRS